MALINRACVDSGAPRRATALGKRVEAVRRGRGKRDMKHNCAWLAIAADP